jgi:hypothetical protein
MKLDRDIPLDDAGVRDLRARRAAVEADLGYAPPESYTCDGCTLVRVCLLAFDGWNTDGDCLREK